MLQSEHNCAFVVDNVQINLNDDTCTMIIEQANQIAQNQVTK